MEDLLNNHLESLRRKRGALAWAFFPDDNAHAISSEAASNSGSRYLVCAACHPNGLPLKAATSLCGGKQTGVFRYHWRTGQRSITDHVNKKHEDLLMELRAAKATHAAAHREEGPGEPTGDMGTSPCEGRRREESGVKESTMSEDERGGGAGSTGESPEGNGRSGVHALPCSALPCSAASKRPRLGAAGGRGGAGPTSTQYLLGVGLPGCPLLLPGVVPRLLGGVPAGLPGFPGVPASVGSALVTAPLPGGGRGGEASGPASLSGATTATAAAVVAVATAAARSSAVVAGALSNSAAVDIPFPVNVVAADGGGGGGGEGEGGGEGGVGAAGDANAAGVHAAAAPATARQRRQKGGHQPAVIDLRSDTVTKPTEAMRRAMAEAAVGDDVFGDDPTVKQLELEMATTFAKEAAVFVPSGTMGNLVAVGVHCEVRGSEFICGNLSHIHVYEQGGLATLMGAHPRPIVNKNDGTMDLDEVRGAVRADDQHFPVTRVLCIEQTHNKCGGRVLPLDYVDRCGEVTREHNIKLHIDGARIWNAAASLGVSPARCVAAADSVSVCLSKGIGAPVGSVIVGTREFIDKCRRLRKACGGTMRQAGVLAAAALMAVKEIHPVLHLDHVRMNELAAGLGKIEGIKVQRPVQSNICFVNFVKEIPVKYVVTELSKYNVIVIPWTGNSIRMVTHHEINQAAVSAVVRALQVIIGEVYKGNGRGENGRGESGKGATDAAGVGVAAGAGMAAAAGVAAGGGAEKE